MYEQNTHILQEMARDSYRSIAEETNKIRCCETEKERVHFLRRVFNSAMERFECIPLWAGGVPGWRDDFILQSKPRMAFFPGVGGVQRGVVLVSAGGGYNVKSFFEGFPVALRFVEAGYSAAVLDYRLKPYSQYTSVLDIQRAVRMLRANADHLNILADRIAVAGFSAGGNLSAMAAVHFDEGNTNVDDPIERVSCRPNAAILCYGAFSQVSFPNIIRFVQYDTPEANAYDEDTQYDISPFLPLPFSDPDLTQKLYFSPEKHIRQNTPPFFLWQTNWHDDPRFVLKLAGELTDWGVPFELHCFPNGPHGLGTADGIAQDNPPYPHVAHWTSLAVEWLAGLEF